MATLTELLLTDEKKPQLVRDSARVVDEEVAAKRGISGVAIKTAYKAVKAFKPTIIPDVMKALIPDFVSRMEPFYARHLEADGGDFAAFCVRDAFAIADALLGITDDRANRSRHRVLVKAYGRLRPQGKKQVIAAMPRVAAMLVRNGA